ncbi:MucBP domain-containing protein [Lactobacillus equicursoris]|uniref:MucBP domain-containing protein n=1 Tax=Lactobacillus equicursoris TaxID=420645 RepID=A0A844FPH8_9LACO|nr:MucBP domain-containing protein [Lactobacillus equicursoris]MST80544.1 MucBP domain-containing protein [Lactobacillus equicursoris]
MTDSDIDPAMSDANGATVKIDTSKVPRGFAVDPTKGRYTFGIVKLGGFDHGGNVTDYNSTHGTNYYIRVSTDATGDKEETYVQVVDANNSNNVIWEKTITPDDGKVSIPVLSNVVDGNTVYYEVKFTKSTDATSHITSRTVGLNSNVGTQYIAKAYESVSSGTIDDQGVVNFLFPTLSTKETKYIAEDANGTKTTLATYDETGKMGQKYTISNVRQIKGYDFVRSPGTNSGTLSLSYNKGDTYVRGYALRIANNVFGVKVLEVSETDGTAKIKLYIAKGISKLDLSKASDTHLVYAGDVDKGTLSAPDLNLLNDSSVWKLAFETSPLKPGQVSDEGNNPYDDGKYPSGGYVVRDAWLKEHMTEYGFTYNDIVGADEDDRNVGWKLPDGSLYKDENGNPITDNHTVNWALLNTLPVGQIESAYYYAPQGQVRLNYVTEDGTVLLPSTTKYENTSTGTAYDVTSSYPSTISVNGKTYRYVKSDKSKGKAGTTTVNGYTYNLTPSDTTGTIASNTVNDVYFVYELVTYSTPESLKETKSVTRTIEYYDSVTGEKIPSNLEDTVTQTATMTRSMITDDKGHKIGYGTVSADGTTYTLSNDWTVADQTWTKQDSKDLTSYSYTAPDKASVEAVTVDGNTTDVTEKVYYGHQTTPVKPGEEWPSNVADSDKVKLTKEITRTINYVDTDSNPVNGSPDGKSQYVQTVEFTRTAIVDKVTGKIVGYDTNSDGKADTESGDRAWLPITQTMAEVKSTDPSKLGYDKVDTPTVSEKIVVPSETIEPITVTYGKDPAVVKGTIEYIDDTTGDQLDLDNLPAGTVGSKIDYTTAEKIKYYEDCGYELVYSTFTDGDQRYTNDGNAFYVHLKHQTETITPNDPKTPGDKINPKGGTTYPDGTTKEDLTASVTRTIIYLDAQTREEVATKDVQTVNFSRTVVIDKVTGKVLNYNAWKVTGDKQDWTEVTSPDLSNKGYEAPDKTLVAEETPTATTANQTVEVLYDHATKSVEETEPVTRTINYVDTLGKAVNGAPDGKADITDGDRAWDKLSASLDHVNSATPSSVGYDSVDPAVVQKATVVPTTKDSIETVVYSKIVAGKVTYIDNTTNTTLDTDNLPSAVVGTKINYTTADKIANYEKQGYKYVSSDFTDGSETYADGKNEFTVYLEHATQTITPNDPNPVTPGKPINPDDPNSPVYPSETDRSNLVKDATQTVHYVDNKGNKVFDDKGQTQKDAFTRTVTIDKVTGKVIETTDWTGTKTFDEETTPVKEGYHADKKTAGGLTATPDNPNIEDKVVYTPNGKIVPVDPNGNKIPNAPTPTYPTDPTDPTKVVPNEPIPDVPNWTPVDPSPVTPADPTKDTPVPYTKDETPSKPETPSTKYGLTEKFVDENGNELVPSVNKGTDYKTGDSYDVTGDAKEIPGYKLVKTTDTTGTFDNGNKTAVFTYQKVEVPSKPATPETPATKYGLTEKFVDENGNELVPSVTKGTDYKTGDSYDVTGDAKEIPGYKLVKTTDTTGTFDNGDKTAVFTYQKVETPSKPATPSVPTTTYGLTEKFVDENGNELVPSVNKGTDYKTGDSYDVTGDAKEIPGYKLVKTTDTTGTFGDSDKTAVFTYQKIETPSKPATPAVPTTPDNNTPSEPAVPSKPAKPATPSQTTTTTSNENPLKPNKVEAATPKSGQATLPQTGSDDAQAQTLTVLGLAALAATSLLNFLGFKKRKDQD